MRRQVVRQPAGQQGTAREYARGDEKCAHVSHLCGFASYQQDISYCSDRGAKEN